MANDIRLRANGVSGQLDTADLAVGTTTMTSAALADLPAVDASHHAAITLFRRNAAGRVTQQEIVWVTAHTAAATTATILRAQEGTTAQTWNGVTTPQDYWVHADTAADYPTITTTGAPSTGTAYFKGQRATAQDGHEFIATATGSPGTWVEAGSTALASVMYDPATQSVISTSATTWGTMDSTNLKVVFTPTTGYVWVTMASLADLGWVASAELRYAWGLLDGSLTYVTGSQITMLRASTRAPDGQRMVYRARVAVTAGTSTTLYAGHRLDPSSTGTLQAGRVLMGGNVWGPFTIDVWTG